MARSYPFTPDKRANALLGRDGTALLIGLCLEQQVRTEKAMIGPYELRKRLGTIDAKTIAKTPPARLDKIFRTPPALHRFPGMMAKRVRALCAAIADEYSGKGERVWGGAKNAGEVYDRLLALPGFGKDKAASAVRILGKFGDIALRGWRDYSSDADMPWVFKDGKRV
ncbi:MAG TPA: HhH-GPD-type base excision DNA repair protein [Candidatus Binatus sp.]|nr:HhH-GPD-type base excision DNA repair protein [Candidatus Binatus sp.]